MTLVQRYLLALSVLLLVQIQLYGQYTSNGGRFQVDEIKGCAGLTVNISITEPSCDCVSGCTCDIDFGDSGADTFTHTYNTPGIYRLTVIFPNPTPSDFIDIEITDKTPPDFSLYACSGNSVKVDIMDTQYDNYRINYGDGNQQVVSIGAADPEHNYANANPRTVVVQGFDNNAVANCASASDSFIPLSAIPPALISSLTVIDETQLELRYNLSPDILYRLEIQPNGSGNFNFIHQLDETLPIDTISNLNLNDTYYCFRVVSIDPCSNTPTYSNTICSINFSLVVQDGSNGLSWITNNPSSDFSITRSLIEESSTTTIDPYQSVTNVSRAYIDNDLICNSNYCYYISAQYNGGTSRSLEKCGISFSTEATESIDNISIVVNEGDVTLDWPQPNTNVSKYVIKRNGAKIGDSELLNYSDELVRGQTQSYCYNVDIVDDCGNTNSEGVQACSIFLEGSIDKNNVVTLNWNDYLGYQSGVNQYFVEKFYQSAAAGTQSVTAPGFTEVDNNSIQQAIGYRVTAQAVDGSLTSSESNLIVLAKPNNIYYPTAFTPDRNGMNDIFYVKGQFIVDYSMQIFNRWGELIFTTDNEDEGWDGSLFGKPQPEGTYIFNVEIVDLAGQEIKKNGSFLLLRK